MAKSKEESKAVVKFQGLSDGLKEKCLAMEVVSQQCSLAQLAAVGHVEKAFLMAKGMQELKNLITDDMMKAIMALQKSPLGFDCDKIYDVQTVKSCFIESLLRGLHPIGNEFNIIAGKMYAAKAGMARMVRDFPGLSNLKKTLKIVKTKDTSALVETVAEWSLNGIKQCRGDEIPIRVNRGMGLDAILGKADRKLSARIYGQLTGSLQTIDGEVGDMIDSTVEIVDQCDALAEQIAEPIQPEADPDKTEPQSQVLKPPETDKATEDLLKAGSIPRQHNKLK